MEYQKTERQKDADFILSLIEENRKLTEENKILQIRVGRLNRDLAEARNAFNQYKKMMEYNNETSK